ncbi:MAG: hypothetical protein WB762_28540 [Candidatus Sulfotelmatobacter sp.]
MYVPEKTPRPDPVLPEDRYWSLLGDARDRAQTYLAQICDRRAGVTPRELLGMESLGGSLPEDGAQPADVLRMLDEAGSNATMATMGGRFFGGVIGGSLPVTIAAHSLADAWDQNACVYDLSPVSAYLRDEQMRKLKLQMQVSADGMIAALKGHQFFN